MGTPYTIVRKAVRLLVACATAVLCARTMAGSVGVVRDLPDAIPTTATEFPVTLAVTVTGSAPNGVVVSEQLPAGWSIAGATWNGEPFAPVLIGGVCKWLFESATGTGMPVGSGTLAYTVDTGGAGAGSYTFAGSAAWLDAGAETQAVTAGETGVHSYAPTTVTSVAVKTGLTVEVAFSAAMDTGALTAANYAVSGTGKGCLAANPDSVVLKGGTTYTLTWNNGEMLNGGDITIAVSHALDAHGLPLGTPSSATDAGHAIGVAPTATFAYLPPAATNQDVVATLVPSETVTVTNNGGAMARTFTGNGTFEFQFADAAGNLGTATAAVTWIDRTAPQVTGTSPVADSTITTTSVRFDVTFDAAVQDVDPTDMVLSGTSTDGSTGVTSATLLSGTTWRFEVTGLKPGSGTLTASLAPDAGDIRDLAGNDLAPVAWSYTVRIPVCHPYDANQNWAISASELQAMKSAWATGSLAGEYDPDYFMLWTIDLWQGGGYHYDPAQTGYRVWQPGSR
jgi:hypothetical protein